MTGVSAEPLLVDLAEQVMENWRSSEMERRRRLWTTHFMCVKQDKVPVKCAVFDFYDLVWQKLIPETEVHFKEGLRRHIEILLRIKLAKFRMLKDDDVIWPYVHVGVGRRRADKQLWGVTLGNLHTGDVGGAYKPVPPIVEEDDLSKIEGPDFIPMPAEEARVADEARALTGGILPIAISTDEVHYGPYEWAVRMRGAEQLLYDVYDRPEWVHRLMGRITDGIVAYHQAREAAGVYDSVTDLPRVHVPYDEPPPGLEKRLAGGWVYSHAQSAASLSPAMYAEFVQPYNARICELFGKVYYHGCEDLGAKAEIIRDLPHLVHFHVSPWTALGDVVPKLAGRGVVLEVHSHPTDVLFTWGESEMRAEIRRRMDEAEGMVFDLKLCDIQTIEGADGQLERWTDVAMEESVR